MTMTVDPWDRKAADHLLRTSPVLTVSEAVYVLRSRGHMVSQEDNGTVSVYAAAGPGLFAHCFDYDENRPTVAARYVLATLNDLSEPTEVKPEDLPTVEFSRTGPVTAATAAYSDEHGNLWIRHPHGGSVLVTNTPNQHTADIAAANVNDALSAWARLR